MLIHAQLIPNNLWISYDKAWDIEARFGLIIVIVKLYI